MGGSVIVDDDDVACRLPSAPPCAPSSPTAAEPPLSLPAEAAVAELMAPPLMATTPTLTPMPTPSEPASAPSMTPRAAASIATAHVPSWVAPMMLKARRKCKKIRLCLRMLLTGFLIGVLLSPILWDLVDNALLVEEEDDMTSSYDPAFACQLAQLYQPATGYYVRDNSRSSGYSNGEPAADGAFSQTPCATSQQLGETATESSDRLRRSAKPLTASPSAVISIRTAHGKLLCADGTGALQTVDPEHAARSPHSCRWHRVILSKNGYLETIVLQSVWDSPLLRGDQARFLSTNTIPKLHFSELSQLDDQQKWSAISLGNGKYRFRTTSGMYLCAEKDGRIVANRPDPFDFEEFTVISAVQNVQPLTFGRHSVRSFSDTRAK
jgi:hypothetical protein